jgi:Protein of unknown function (DUF2961).
MQSNNMPLYKAQKNLRTKWASPENLKAEKGMGGQADKGRKGAPYLPLKTGQSHVLACEENASGMVRRIWMTINDRSPEMLRGLRLDFYWDGAEAPAVSAPLGDFFGIGLGRTAAFQSALFSNPEGRSFNCCIPMPFRTGMKLVIANESGKDLDMLFYDIDYTLGDVHDDDVLYFHAHFRRENPTREMTDYEILPRILGCGRFLGCNVGVKADTARYFRSWWGEGEVKCYIDGDRELPTLCGTGTEDYIGTGWGQGRYDHLYQGCPVADHDKFEYCFYRQHVADPVLFNEDIRVTIQQIGGWDIPTKKEFFYNGAEIRDTKGNMVDFAKGKGSVDFGQYERSDDWSSCAYFYLDKPENSLPKLDDVEKRLPQGKRA